MVIYKIQIRPKKFLNFIFLSFPLRPKSIVHLDQNKNVFFFFYFKAFGIFILNPGKLSKYSKKKKKDSVLLERICSVFLVRLDSPFLSPAFLSSPFKYWNKLVELKKAMAKFSL